MDIVAKLRDGAAQAGHYGAWSGGVLMEQAADEIEALRREQTQNTKISEAMREALEMTRGNIASLAAAGRCTTYEDWARGIDQALVYADFAGTPPKAQPNVRAKPGAVGDSA